MRRYLISFFLIISFLLTSCQPSGTLQTTNISFKKFTDSLFREWVSSDSLTLNYTLKEPDKYGITSLPKGFDVSTDDSSTNCQAENLLDCLHQFKKENLSQQQKILYDTLADFLSQELSGIAYQAYTDVLNPSSGIQAQLPVLLAEFHLQSEQDIEQYFLLLKSLPAYFNKILLIENEKKTSGTLPARTTLQKVICQCESFLQKDGCKMIQSCFTKQVQKQFSQDAAALNRQHNKYLQNYLIPAYQKLITGLTSLLPYAPSDGALAAYANGRQYYTYLFHKKTGSSESVEHWQRKLRKRLNEAEKTLLNCAASEPSAFRTCEDYQRKYASPETILHTLQQKMQKDFPACSSTTYQLHSVDPCLEEYLSPAFYLTPPIDDRKSNAIYINHSPKYSHSSLFNTLAHEAYPGHLYQNCYMREQKMPLLRYLLDYPGYTEGYATYAEIYSYRYTGASKTETCILQNNAIATHCLYALCDIGIHYQHWSKNELSAFLTAHGVQGSQNANRIYESVVDSPGSYLPYTIGYLQIEDLRQNFDSDKEFHTYLLNMGPTSFEILGKYR